MLSPLQLLSVLQAGSGPVRSRTTGKRDSTSRPAPNFRATRAGCDTRAALLQAATPSPIGGVARSSILAWVISTAAHAILFMVLLAFGAIAAGMVAALLGSLFVLSPGRNDRSR